MARTYPLLLSFVSLLVFCPAQAPEAKPFDAPYFARAVSAGRIHGGAGDYHFPFRRLSRGEVVRVIGAQDGWLRIAPMGDLDVFVVRRFSGRDMLRSDDGRLAWVVVGSDVQIRGRILTSEKDYPPVGELQPNDQVVVLDFPNDRWARIAIPVGAAQCWVPARHLERVADQAAVQSTFRTEWESARHALLASGAVSSKRSTAVQERAAMTEKTQAATANFQRQEGLSFEKRDVKGVREQLLATRDGWPEGSPARDRIELMLAEVAGWEQAQAEVIALRKKVEEQNRVAEQTEAEHTAAIKSEREAAERRIANLKLPAKSGRFLYSGWVRRVVKTVGLDKASPDYYLEVGGQRAAFLECERYDLSEFTGVLVGVSKLAGKERVRPGDSIKTLRVARIEIIHTGR